MDSLPVRLPVPPARALATLVLAAPEVHLAPPLPAPPPSLGLLVAALVILGAAVVPIGLLARRLRRAAVPAPGPAELAGQRLAGVKAAALAACQCPVPTASPGSGAYPCADAVHRVLAEFAGAATGLPCVALTTRELRACQGRLPEGTAAAMEPVVRVLERCDRCRFEPVWPCQDCLVAAAVDAVRAWPAGVGSEAPQEAAESSA